MSNAEYDEPAVSAALVALQERFASDIGLTLAQYKRLTTVLRTEELVTVLELVRRRRHASPYRQRCSDRVKAWLSDPRSVGKPLDPYALKRCEPHWPISIKLPTRAMAIEHLSCKL